MLAYIVFIIIINNNKKLSKLICHKSVKKLNFKLQFNIDTIFFKIIVKLSYD